jgi:UDP-N-acetylglucosamine 2-epimerase (non-hydrolysing)
VRENTERPITITHGTNTLVSDVNELLQLVRTAGGPRSKAIIEGWDGRAGERVVQAISKTFGVQQLISR